MKKFLLLVVLLASFTTASAEEGKEREFIRQGRGYVEARDYQKGVKAFIQAARLNPENIEAHRGMGECYLRLGFGETATNPEALGSAELAFKEALRLDPKSTDTHYQLGLTYLALGDKDRAMREYQVLADVDPTRAVELRSRIDAAAPHVSFHSSSSGSREDAPTRVTIVGNQVFVPVTLGHRGHSTEATLILDTGASVTVISTEIAQKLGIDLSRAKRTLVRVVGGGAVECWQTRIDVVTAGPHTRNSIDVAVIAQKGGGFAFDGLLGMNFLRNFTYHLDFANQTISWDP